MTEPAASPPARFIGSDRVAGLPVHDARDVSIGTVDRFVIDRQTGKVVYVVVSFGGFLDMGGQPYTLPWARLRYDAGLGGYRTDVSESELRAAPASARGAGSALLGEAEEEELHAHFRIPPYWRSAV